MNGGRGLTFCVGILNICVHFYSKSVVFISLLYSLDKKEKAKPLYFFFSEERGSSR